MFMIRGKKEKEMDTSPKNKINILVPRHLKKENQVGPKKHDATPILPANKLTNQHSFTLNLDKSQVLIHQ